MNQVADYLDDAQCAALAVLDRVNAGDLFGGVIVGAAGVGKSLIISEFVRHNPEVKVAAPTHKACEVLRKRGVENVRTIHSLMYEVVDETEERPVLDKNDQPVIDPETRDPIIEKVIIGQRWYPR